MSATSDPTGKPLPWGASWVDPRLAIDRVIATDSGPAILILAIVAGVAQAVAQTLAFTTIGALRDWRIVLGSVLLGVVSGMISLYVQAPFLGWTARLFGGHAPISNVRAAVAWGAVPLAIGLSIGLIIFGLLGLAGAMDGSKFVQMLTGLVTILYVWALVTTIAMFAQVESFGISRALACFVLWLLAGLAAQVAIRTFLYQPFSIPSGAMMPTLLVGDHLLLSKYTYGYSRYSLPFSLPLFAGRKFASDPDRGDLVVFRLPKDPSTDYVKRVVGLPSERIQMINGVLHINGIAVRRERIEDFIDTEDNGRQVRIKQWRETLPNGVSYRTLDLIDNGFYDNTKEYRVPAGHYFMMGDNRDNSTDSRVESAVGYVPLENLVGRAQIIYFSIDWTSRLLRSDRLGLVVR